MHESVATSPDCRSFLCRSTVRFRRWRCILIVATKRGTSTLISHCPVLARPSKQRAPKTPLATLLRGSAWLCLAVPAFMPLHIDQSWHSTNESIHLSFSSYLVELTSNPAKRESREAGNPERLGKNMHFVRNFAPKEPRRFLMSYAAVS